MSTYAEAERLLREGKTPQEACRLTGASYWRLMMHLAQLPPDYLHRQQNPPEPTLVYEENGQTIKRYPMAPESPGPGVTARPRR